MNYQAISYKTNDDLDDSNSGSVLAEDSSIRRKGSSCSSSFLDAIIDDKHCSPSSGSSSIHGPRKLDDNSEEMVLKMLEDRSESRSSLKRSHENCDDDEELKKQKVFNIHIETEQPIKIKGSKSEITEQLTELQKISTVSVTEQTGKRTLAKQANGDAKQQKIDITQSIKNLEHFRKFMMRKDIRRPSQRVLEEFTLQKMCEIFYQHNQEMLRLLRIKDMAFESLRTKYTALQKQVTDIDIVQTRISNAMRKVKDPRDVVPLKITRSVGLQVCIESLKTKVNLPAPVSHAPAPTIPITCSIPLKEMPQRALAATNRVSMLPPSPSAVTPAPAHIRPPPGPTDKAIETIVPKISNNGQTKDVSNSLFGNILQKFPTTNNSADTASLRKFSGDYVKMIDLTDADHPNRASTSPGTQLTSGNIRVVTDLTDEKDSNRISTCPGTQSSSGNIRVVVPPQLSNPSSEAVSPLVTTNKPRLPYLVQSTDQHGQSVLLAKTNAPTRPGEARPTLMFKPVVPQDEQKLNLVRTTVPGTVAVPPPTLGSPEVCKYVTTYAPGPVTRSSTLATRATAPAPRHPAPLPGPTAVQASQPFWKLLPPKPSLKITLVTDGIVLSWRILNKNMLLCEEIASYELYAYQETRAPPTTEMWRKVGNVKALKLPMTCTLTQFTYGNKYYFAVRGVDVKKRVGPFSTPEQIILPAQ